jgi:hypothetical protein
VRRSSVRRERMRQRRIAWLPTVLEERNGCA